MSGNTFGTLLRITTFGESHAAAIGGIIEGLPSGIALDLAAIRSEMQRRRPGQSALTTQRKETDEFEILSGFFEGKTTGTPLAFTIANQSQRSQDYDQWATAFRPNHGDFTYHQKYGHRDYRGGGRASARETAARVFAGAVAKQLLKNVQITAYVDQVGRLRLDTDQTYTAAEVEAQTVRCPDPAMAQQMEALIREVRKNGDSVGGAIRCHITGVPAGWGEPVFDKLQAQLAHAMLSINAAKGFEYGDGFASAAQLGSQHLDYFTAQGHTRTNHSGGIQAGISNGMPIDFRVAFKPVATLMQPLEVLTEAGEIQTIPSKGRHDPCVVPRAVVIVEAMAALVLADAYLQQNKNLINN